MKIFIRVLNQLLDMPDIDISVSDKGDVLINDYPFNMEDFKRIKTRILRNEFKGDYSHLKGMSGTTVIRMDDKLVLGKPKETPKFSWSYKEWVEKSDGWMSYAEGTQDAWKDALNSIDI